MSSNRQQKTVISMREAEDYLDSTPRFTNKSSLENIRKYLARFGNPERGLRIVHVAGTNGKGSVCAQIASCLREAGLSTGLFISPHLSVIRERISLDGEMIPEEEFLALFSEVKQECLRAAEEGLPHLLYFEMLFMMAMLWFSEKRPDYVILETGLGGRLDATNAVEEKEVTVITRIGLDHTALLGNTEALIAQEKAGILRRNCPAVFLTEPEDAYKAILEKAGEVCAPVSPMRGKAKTALVDVSSCVGRKIGDPVPGLLHICFLIQTEVSFHVAIAASADEMQEFRIFIGKLCCLIGGDRVGHAFRPRSAAAMIRNGSAIHKTADAFCLIVAKLDQAILGHRAGDLISYRHHVNDSPHHLRGPDTMMSLQF